MAEQPYGCGVIEHPVECLCDVVITKPTPITVTSVQDFHMGRQIAEIRGYSAPWSNDQLLSFFEDLCLFHDKWNEQKHNYDGNQYDSLEDIPPILDGFATFQQWQIIRDTVQYCMDNYGQPLVYILQHLGVSAQDFIVAVTTNSCDKQWSYSDIALLDNAMMVANVNYAEVAREFDITEGIVDGLRKYFEKRRNEMYGSEFPVKDAMHKLALCTDKTPSQIRDEILSLYGVEYSVSAISKYRKRNAHRH